MEASSSASETTAVEVVSTMTKSAFSLRSARSFLICAAYLSSDKGAAFRFKTAESSVPGTLQRRLLSASEEVPFENAAPSRYSSNSVNCASCIFNILAREGFWKSISARITLRFIWDIASAMLAAVVDLPSPSAALETSRIFCPSRVMSFIRRIARLRISSAYPGVTA